MITKIEAISNANSPSVDESRKQLARILRHKEFLRSPKSSKFLKYVVEETISERQSYLKAYTIALAVFGKDQAFDPQTDPIVRVQAVRLRKILQQYYLNEGKNDEVIINLLKGSYIPKIYYNNESNVELDATEEQKHTVIPSIAVIPFKSLSDDKSQEYFTDGITEELIFKLSLFKEILVIARHSTSQYKDKTVDPKLLGNELDVRFLLSGSVRKAGNQIRVSVELIETTNSCSIWLKTFDKQLTVENVISIQDIIAAHVASNVAQPYGVILGKDINDLTRTPTTNLTAYEYFLRYYQFLMTMSQEDYIWAREGLELATELDPNYSNAWAALAILYTDEYQLNYGDNVNDEILDQACETVKKALATGPENSLAYYALFHISVAKNDIKTFKEAGERALQLNPHNALILAEYGQHLAYTGEWEKGLELVEHAMTINPSHPGFYHIPFVVYYLHQDQYEEALHNAKKINMPDFFWPPLITASIYGLLDDKISANKHLNILTNLYPDIANNARFELEKWNLQEEVVLKFLTGLNQAGLRIDL